MKRRTRKDTKDKEAFKGISFSLYVFLICSSGNDPLSLSSLWSVAFAFAGKAQEEKEEMAALRTYNMKLVANILPLHVAEHFLKGQNKKDEVNKSFRRHLNCIFVNAFLFTQKINIIFLSKHFQTVSPRFVAQ